MAHPADEWWKSHELPLCVVFIKSGDRFCYKLSLRTDWFQFLRAVVRLNNENDFVLRAINNTDICLGMSVVTANKKGEVHSRARQSLPTNITQNLEQFDGKINGSFALIGEIKQPDLFCITVLLHIVSIENRQQLFINHRLWQLL